MSTAPLPVDERDQPILLAISTVMEDGPSEQLFRAFSVGTQQLTAEWFCSALLSSDHVLNLFEPAVHFALTERPPFQDADPAVLNSMRRLLTEKASGETKLQDTISKALRTAVRLSLRVASSLMNQFVVPGESLLQGDALVAVRNAFWVDLRISFSGEQGPQQLIAASLEAPIYSLIWCAWGLDRIRAGNFDGLPFEGWNELASTAVTAAEHDPVTMLRQLVPFLVDRHDHFPRRQEITYTFNHERSEHLFDMARLTPVLRAAPEATDATIKDMVNAIRRQLDAVSAG